MNKLKSFRVMCHTEFGLGTYKTKGSDMQNAYDRLSAKQKSKLMSITDDETNEEYLPKAFGEYMTWEEYKADQLEASKH